MNNDELEAENARLAQEVQRLGQDNSHLRQTINTLLSESASLRQLVRGTDISVHYHFIP